MHSLKEIQLKCNKQFILNFDGGELSSDGGLLMIKKFLHAPGIEKLLKNSFKTNDPALFRIHKDDENLLQMLCQIFGTYYEDNCADELRHDPVFSAVLGKEFNWFRRLALPKHMDKSLVDTVRLKLLKVAAKVVHTGRYVKFKLCSSCPYKEEVFETFRNIWGLAVQLE